jgi:hypothetical protein
MYDNFKLMQSWNLFFQFSFHSKSFDRHYVGYTNDLERRKGKPILLCLELP